MASPSASPFPSPTIPADWQTYADTQYGFSIAYPAGFTFQDQGAGPPGALQGYRAVDNRYLNGYPPGQVELNLFSMDADSVSAWISKHTGPPGAPAGQAAYFQATANVQMITAAGRAAIYFDATIGNVTAHAIAFQQGSLRVDVLDWWSTDPTYAATVELIAQQMLASFQG